MRASDSSWAQPQLQPQLQSPPQLQPPMRASDSVWAPQHQPRLQSPQPPMRASDSVWVPQPQHQPQLQLQPQPQPLHRGRPHQARWKAGIVGLYGASAPAMDPILGEEIIGEKKGRAPRMFHQPPKRKSDAFKAAKQASFSSSKRE